MMTATESKEEISDTDSGIIIHSGPDSPTSPLKDLTTHTRAMKLKHQSLEDRLELCLLELRKLCIREAELTGKLSSDYPLTPDENPPRIRRRIGAAFKIDEGLIDQKGEDSELHSLEADLALQRQIFEAARRLSAETNLSKPQKKTRLQQCKREEKKVKDLQEALLQHRIKSEAPSPNTSNPANHREMFMSDDSSLSDVVAMDDDVDSSGALSPPALLSSYGDPLLSSASSMQSSKSSLQESSSQALGSSSSVEHERSPIQNAPWRESSLDQPYQKANKPTVSACSSRSSSPVGSPVCGDIRALPSMFPSIKNLAMRYPHSCSAPSTPELRRQYSQSFRLPKIKPGHDPERFGSNNSCGRARLPQRNGAADFVVHSPERSSQRVYQSSSEDSSSEHSAASYSSSPSRDGPIGIPKLCPPPYGFHLGAQNNGPSNLRSPNTYRKNSNQLQASRNNSQGVADDGPLSPRHLDLGKLYLSSPPPMRQNSFQRQWQDGPSSPKRVMKPPPPYTRLVRTPSLREYPFHAARMMPREIVSEELKSWHQRNQFQKSHAGSLEHQSSFRVTSTNSPHPPPYKQSPSTVILQRAADGTPLQWFVEEDSEIVSQV
ncbi:innate immunity activator protein [Aplochiton taeniatus]